MDKEADFGPAEVGENVTVNDLLTPAAIVVSVGDTRNCEASVPVTMMPEMDRLPLPGFEIVKVFCEVPPTAVLSIANEVADRLI
jgi:hypothetical protein